MDKDQIEYDLIIIGGGLAATFLCLNIFKIDPNFKLLIIEKDAEFPQKIGESIIDETALIIQSLGIDDIMKRQVVKSGIRYTFNELNSKEQRNISELASPTLNGRIKGFHLNRKIFDEDMLAEVERKGAVVFRPAQIIDASFKEFENELSVEFNDAVYNVKSKWLVDATGRTRYIAKTLNWADKKIVLNTGAVMAHFTGITDDSKWDTPRNEFWEANAIAERKFSTIHLMRPHAWWWIIRISETETSIGVVFDKNHYSYSDKDVFFKGLIDGDEQLSLLTKEAQMSEVKAVQHIPYVAEKLFTKGIALLGDTGAFIDPLIAPGLELMGQQTIWLATLFTEEKNSGYFNEKAWKKYEKVFQKAYASRLIIYKKAYDYMHSYDLFTTWIKQGNFVYFSKIVIPSALFPKKLKTPLQFNGLEKGAIKFFVWRYDKISLRRKKQKRVSKQINNRLEYSGVRIPKDARVLLIPIKLLLKSIWSYFRLELNEIPHYFKKSNK